MRCFQRRMATMEQQQEIIPTKQAQAQAWSPSAPYANTIQVAGFSLSPNSFCSCSSFIQSQIFTRCLKCARHDSNNPESLFSSLQSSLGVTHRSPSWNLEWLPTHDSYLLFIAPLLRNLDHQMCFKQRSNIRTRGEDSQREWGLPLSSLPALFSLPPGSWTLQRVPFYCVLTVCMSVNHPQVFHSFLRAPLAFSLELHAQGVIQRGN